MGDAEHLPCDDASIDRIVGGAILHHLDLNKAYSEIARALKPGGLAVFVEPMGHNPIINWYRRRTPQMRTPDEHPLLLADFDHARGYFRSVSVEYFHLTSLGVVPLRATPLFRPAYALTDALDRTAMRFIPSLRGWAWSAVIQLSR